MSHTVTSSIVSLDFIVYSLKTYIDNEYKNYSLFILKTIILFLVTLSAACAMYSERHVWTKLKRHSVITDLQGEV